MATFVIEQPEIRKVTKQGANFGKEYLYCKIRPKMDFFGQCQTYTSFEEHVVAGFKQLLPIDKGGVAQTAQPLPEEARNIVGVWVDFTPATPFKKTHLSSHPAGQKMINGQLVNTPAIQQGELVKAADGTPIVFNTLRVFCRQAFDDITNKYDFPRGESPVEIGMRAYSTYCIPVQAAEEPVLQVSAPSTPSTPQGNPNPQQPPQFTGAPQGGAAQFG